MTLWGWCPGWIGVDRRLEHPTWLRGGYAALPKLAFRAEPGTVFFAGFACAFSAPAAFLRVSFSILQASTPFAASTSRASSLQQTVSHTQTQPLLPIFDTSLSPRLPRPYPLPRFRIALSSVRSSPPCLQRRSHLRVSANKLSRTNIPNGVLHRLCDALLHRHNS